MIERALVHVAGPEGAGKTAFSEAVLTAVRGSMLVARCARDDALSAPCETSPQRSPELRRYREAGASGAALFAFPVASGADPFAFYETDLMMDYSAVVIIEGDNPVKTVDLEVFVAPPPDAGEALFVRRTRDVAVAERAKADAWERLLHEADGVARWLAEIVGGPIVEFARENPQRVEDVRLKVLAGIESARKAPPAEPVERWTIADRYAGIERAGLVVVNVPGDHVIISLTSEEEQEFDEGGEGWLASIIPVRTDMAAGDLRALYLGWLLCAQAGQLEDDDLEPPVPPNLTRLTASLRALIDFLSIDEDLVAVAAAGSPEVGTDQGSDEELARCIEGLPAAEKDALLLRAVRGDGAHLRTELLQRIRPGANGGAAPGDGQRTVAELLAAAESRREEARRRAMEQKARERARREREAAIAYEKRLDALALREDAAWQQVDTHIESRKPAEYDQAVQLLKDLKALDARKGTVDAFDQRVRRLRERHVKKVSLLERLTRGGL